MVDLPVSSATYATPCGAHRRQPRGERSGKTALPRPSARRRGRRGVRARGRWASPLQAPPAHTHTGHTAEHAAAKNATKEQTTRTKAQQQQALALGDVPPTAPDPHTHGVDRPRTGPERHGRKAAATPTAGEPAQIWGGKPHHRADLPPLERGCRTEDLALAAPERRMRAERRRPRWRGGAQRHGGAAAAAVWRRVWRRRAPPPPS